MAKHKEYSKTFGIFYDNFRRWCKDMASRGDLSEHPEEQFFVDATESAGGIVNPHFRRGYFKRLESDFYKNKKGQIIFVHETVVNAQAKTLE